MWKSGKRAEVVKEDGIDTNMFFKNAENGTRDF